MRIRGASSIARVLEAQSTSEALEKQGFNPKSTGSDAQTDSRAQRAAPSASASRAPQLFLARTPLGGGKLRFQPERARSI
eukprot:15462560-Alexandrium_andersonii.AAC.1